MEREKTKEYRVQNISDLCKPEIFSKCVKYAENEYRPYDSASYLYREIIERHQEKTLQILLSESRFKELIYATLTAFNMNGRAAKMFDFKKFCENLENVQPYVSKLGSLDFRDIKDEQELNKFLLDIEPIFKILNVMASKSQLVGVSKTLHFLFPKLIMPIDRKFTLEFFHLASSQDKDEAWYVFRKIFEYFFGISKEVKSEFPTKGSLPKLIDNAIIGFVSMPKKNR